MLPYLLSDEAPKKGKEMLYIFNHALDSTLFTIPGIGFEVTRFGVMIVLAGLVLLAMAMRMDRKSAVPQGFIRNMFESIMLFIRDEMVRPTMGRQYGDRFLPFFCTLFLFILAINLLGLIPIPIVGGTATSNYLVTGTLAIMILGLSVVSGFVVHGAGGFMKTFIPGGLPAAIVPLLFPLEVIGFLIKHSVLCVRLFANMIAGHLVLGAFIGLIFVSKSYLTAVPSIGMALFISGLELLVAFIQAYVFTLLSVLFVGGVVHPDH